MSARTRPALAIPSPCSPSRSLAGGGTAVATAAAKIAAKNSVTSKSIKNNNVKSARTSRTGPVESVRPSRTAPSGPGDVADGSARFRGRQGRRPHRR